MTSPAPLPAAAFPPAPRSARVNETPETLGSHASVLDPGRWANRWTGLAGPLEVPAAPSPPPAPPAPSLPPEPSAVVAASQDVPQWVDPAGWGAEDRALLRRALVDRYDAYARVVTRTLAEEPGLRAAGGGRDLVTDLVALCAYTAERQAVNDILRGVADGPAGAYSLIARGASSGLCRLPTVIGPVYAASDAAVGADYRAGDELVEPGFVDVRLTGGGEPGATVEYVIWSVSARRVDRFTPEAQPAATFPPGSRFAVLAVDEPAAEGPLRVLLSDRTGERPAAGERWGEMLQRLRRGAAAGGAGPGRLGAPLGLDRWGHPFTATSRPTSVPVTSGGPRP
ncbi:hypothetical protein [Dactylosporangium sp. NPDC005555]|uniref:hypothetical protein n=1 Tax=Dactylosporangium sp. NPDC005555 TaxID=3154889 RepID=UPI0033A1244B